MMIAGSTAESNLSALMFNEVTGENKKQVNHSKIGLQLINN
jgi:hypothetical protein